jgi:hypothetical protein
MGREDGQGRRRRLRCAPLVAMMETTDFGDRDDRPGGCSGDRSVIWCVLLEAEVRSAPMILSSGVEEVGDAPR